MISSGCFNNTMRKTSFINVLVTSFNEQSNESLKTCFFISHLGPRPIEEAISTAGGVPQLALDDHLMLKSKPGIFCAGEMLDWEAPTGGYLITGCLATGKCAGSGASDFILL